MTGRHACWTLAPSLSRDQAPGPTGPKTPGFEPDAGKVEQLFLVVADDSRGLPKVTARFIYGEIKYWLTVTDPDIEKKYLLKGIGEYPITSIPVYLTVSISEPFEGFCYKLVAGILFPPDSEA